MKYQKRNRPYENVKENVLVLTNDGKSIITLNNTAFAIWQNCDEYSCAATPQIRQTGNRLSGLAETAYASLLAQCFV